MAPEHVCQIHDNCQIMWTDSLFFLLIGVWALRSERRALSHVAFIFPRRKLPRHRALLVWSTPRRARRRVTAGSSPLLTHTLRAPRNCCSWTPAETSSSSKTRGAPRSQTCTTTILLEIKLQPLQPSATVLHQCNIDSLRNNSTHSLL